MVLVLVFFYIKKISTEEGKTTKTEAKQGGSVIAERYTQCEENCLTSSVEKLHELLMLE